MRTFAAIWVFASLGFFMAGAFTLGVLALLGALAWELVREVFDA